MARIAVLASYTQSLVNFRGDMIRDWVSRGHEVFTCAPETGFEKQIEALGASFRRVRLSRTGMNPLKDVAYLFDLRAFLLETRPDMVFSYTIKPVIYGSLVASFVGIPKIFSMITGAGFAFEGARESLFRRLLLSLYRVALSKNTCVIFQNPDDQELFLRRKLVGKNQKNGMVNGSGVNIEHFAFSEPPTNPVVFLLIGRLIPEKGVYEYVNAARVLKKKFGGKVVFRLLGPFEERVGAIKKEELESWQGQGIIEYLGKRDDVRPFLTETSVYVLPSYREGTPRSVLEALSTGRAVITTDTPGCRETVRDGENGFLVPARDSQRLAETMRAFVLDPNLIKKMAFVGRAYAEAKYDVRKVNHALSRIMEL